MGRIGRKNPDDTVDVVIFGKVTRDAKLDYTREKGLPKVTFGVAYASKTFMNCLCLGNNPQTRVAACLEKGDIVLCAGTWSERKYTTRDGEEKTWSELKCDIVIPQPDMAGEATEADGTDEDAGELDLGEGELPF